MFGVPQRDHDERYEYAEDWVNEIFLSARFRAHRDGPYNEYIYTFFKCLSIERMAYCEGYYASRSTGDETFRCGAYEVQRRCPHLRADLQRFGTLRDDHVLHCQVHGWEFDLATGRSAPVPEAMRAQLDAHEQGCPVTLLQCGAWSELGEAARLAPSMPEIQLNLGLVHHLKRDYRAAIAAFEQAAANSPYANAQDTPQNLMMHHRMVAKLMGYTAPEAALSRFSEADRSVPARYARAIATYRHADLRAAIAQIDALIAQQPNNPYFHELKGQALLEGAKPHEAIAPLRRAVSLAPVPGLVQILLAQALIATNDPKNADEAVAMLKAALGREPESPEGYTQLAMAYGRKGDLAQADLASAKAAFTRGDIKTARELATRAKTRFPVGTPGWVKADDIVSFKPPSSGPAVSCSLV